MDLQATTESQTQEESAMFLHRLLLTAVHRDKFIDRHCITAFLCGMTGFTARIFNFFALRSAIKKADSIIEKNGYDPNDLPNYEMNFTLFYAPEHGISVYPKLDISEYTLVSDPIAFYNAPRYKEDKKIVCNAIHENMFDLLDEKYQIDCGVTEE